MSSCKECENYRSSTFWCRPFWGGAEGHSITDGWGPEERATSALWSCTLCFGPIRQKEMMGRRPLTKKLEDKLAKKFSLLIEERFSLMDQLPTRGSSYGPPAETNYLQVVQIYFVDVDLETLIGIYFNDVVMKILMACVPWRYYCVKAISSDLPVSTNFLQYEQFRAGFLLISTILSPQRPRSPRLTPSKSPIWAYDHDLQDVKCNVECCVFEKVV